MPAPTLAALLTLMADLRDPARGCPWDRSQTFASIAPYTIEEAYEVADAIARGDLDGLRDELGDLLFQVVFHARIAEEAGLFAFGDVIAAIHAKMVRRHPHVFDEAGALREATSPLADAASVAAVWEAAKARERPPDSRPLAGITLGLPALTRAAKLSAKAAGYGFDWADAAPVVAKVREEVDEVAEAMAAGSPDAMLEEVGDLLFSVANLARHLGIDPERALRLGNAKFERRFDAMAARLAGDGRPLGRHDLSALEAAWQAVKAEERDKME